AYILWGLLTIYWKTLHGFPPFELIGWRITSSFVILMALAVRNRRVKSIAGSAFSRTLGPRMAAAALLVTVNWSSYVWAVAHDHVIETALGYFMAPLLTMWLGVSVLKEKLNAAQRTTIALAGVAIVILTAGYGRVPFLALLIAGSWALYGLLKRQVPMSSLDSLTAEMMWLVAPAIGLAVAQSSSAESVTSKADGLHLALVVLTGLITVVPLWMFGYAAKRVPLTVLGPLQYSVPTINFLLGWLAYNEDLDTTKLVGFGFVWVALVVLGVDTYRRSVRRSVSSTEPYRR
ncbi:MAG: EamA family transporter RarD, partial [Actinomycetota bacterium]